MGTIDLTLYKTLHGKFYIIIILTEPVIMPILTLAGSYLAGELYKRYATPEQKRRWQNFVKIHHGEAGVIMTGVGILAKSPTLTASGIGLMLHDRDDAGRWFRKN